MRKKRKMRYLLLLFLMIIIVAAVNAAVVRIAPAVAAMVNVLSSLGVSAGGTPPP